MPCPRFGHGSTIDACPGALPHEEAPHGPGLRHPLRRFPGSVPLGVSRPPLAVADLPEPEEVFGVRKLGPRELFQYALGPSLIALGISIGSGEWLLGPQAVGQYGFVGVGWVILISAVLQTFYNVECSRYVLATGEAPVVGWGRVPPGFRLWVPLSVFVVIFAFIAGGWAAVGRARASTRSCTARSRRPAPRSRGCGRSRLLVLVFLITAAAKRISRSLELANWVMVGAILVGLLLIDLFVVPFDLWWEGIRGFVTPADAARRHHRHPARRAGRVHRAGVRPQLVRDGPLPRQGLRHGLPHRLHLRPARRPHGDCSPAGVTFPDDRGQHSAAGSGGTGCC